MFGRRGANIVHSVGPGGFKIAFSEGGWGGWVACLASLKVAMVFAGSSDGMHLLQVML